MVTENLIPYFGQLHTGQGHQIALMNILKLTLILDNVLIQFSDQVLRGCSVKLCKSLVGQFVIAFAAFNIDQIRIGVNDLLVKILMFKNGFLG